MSKTKWLLSIASNNEFIFFTIKHLVVLSTAQDHVITLGFFRSWSEQRGVPPKITMNLI